jgi:hypothetical protein
MKKDKIVKLAELLADEGWEIATIEEVATSPNFHHLFASERQSGLVSLIIKPKDET